MTKMDSLFVHAKSSDFLAFLYSEHPLECPKCAKVIEHGNRVTVVRFWNRTKGKEMVLCASCHPEKGDNSIIAHTVTMVPARLVQWVPSGCRLVMPVPPDLVALKSSFDAGRTHPPLTKLKDRTVYAGRESWEGVLIGDPNIFEKIVENNKLLLTDEAIRDYLKELQTMKTALPDVPKKKRFPKPKKKLPNGVLYVYAKK